MNDSRRIAIKPFSMYLYLVIVRKSRLIFGLKHQTLSMRRDAEPDASLSPWQRRAIVPARASTEQWIG